MSASSPDVMEKVPELLYLLHGDPADLKEALDGLRAADIASISGAAFASPMRRTISAR